MAKTRLLRVQVLTLRLSPQARQAESRDPDPGWEREAEPPEEAGRKAPWTCWLDIVPLGLLGDKQRNVTQLGSGPK